MTDWNAETWGAIGAASVAAVVGGVKAWRVLSKKMEKMAVADAVAEKTYATAHGLLSVQRSSEIFLNQQTFLRSLVDATPGAMRSLSLTVKNGGTPWPPDKPLYISCIDQACAPGVPNTWKRWRNQECDPDYRVMLHDLLASGSHGILVETSRTRGTLGEHYVSQGTVASVVFSVLFSADDHSLICCSINFGRPGIYNDEEDNRDEIDSYVEHARSFLTKPDAVASAASELNAIWQSRV